MIPKIITPDANSGIRGNFIIYLFQSGLVRRSFGVANRQYWMQIRFLESILHGVKGTIE